VRTRAALFCCLLILIAPACANEDEPDRFVESPRAESPIKVAGQETFRFMVMGDYGVGTDDQQAVADAMKDFYGEFGSDAIVTTGDNVYPSGEPEDFDIAWSEPFSWVEGTSLRVIPSLGNHDVIDDGGQPVMDFFDMPGPYYETSVGDADIFVLDGNDVLDPKQAAWLRKHLSRSDAAWQIAVFHQPAFSCARHDSTPEVIDRWVPIFASEGVDLVLNGHDHNYQRFGPVDGVTYVVTGGGGNFLDEAEECPATVPERVAADGEHHHFVAIAGSEDQLKARVIGVDEKTIDHFTLTH
jgi:hypothetical protein